MLFESVRSIEDLNMNVWKVLFSQVNDHRVILMLGFNYLLFLSTGMINLKISILLLNFFGLMLLALFIKNEFKLNKIKMTGLLFPLLLLVYNPLNYKTLMWTTTIYELHLTTLIAIVSFQLIFRNKYFYLGLILAVFITFSNGNGFLCIFAPIIVFIFNKSWKKALINTVVLAITLFFYFNNFRIGGQTDIGKLPLNPIL